MFLKQRLAACMVIGAALAAPVASAAAASAPGTDPGQGYPRCPANYTGPTNPATGCPPALMIYGPSQGGIPTLSTVGIPTQSTVGIPMLSAVGTPIMGAAGTPGGNPSLGYPRCPANYTGPVNPATGCPPALMIYGPPPAV
jgi:hypothetical protein